MDKIKLVLLICICLCFGLYFWQSYRNGKLEAQIQTLEVDKAVKQAQVDTLTDTLDEAKEQAASYSEFVSKRVAELTAKTGELSKKLDSITAERGKLTSKIDDLKTELANTPHMPDEEAAKVCPELPILRQLNLSLTEQLTLCDNESSLKSSIITNKDEEIGMLENQVENFQTVISDQDKLNTALQERIAITDKQLELCMKKKESKWIPKPFFGVAAACSVTGNGCLFGPSIGIGWRF